MELIQNEMHYVNEKLTINIDIKPINNGFIINYDNGRVKDDKFSICLDSALLLSLLKEFEKKSKDIFLKEDLKINKVNFDFFRGNSLYFDVYFENKVNKDSYQGRINVYFQSNNHGASGDIYAFELIDSMM